MRPELHDRGDDLGRDLREFGDEHRGERLLDLRLVLLEAAGALDLEKVLVFFDMYLRKEVCSIVNANVSARLILGLSKCGMHGEEPVRLKRLKRPWIDQD